MNKLPFCFASSAAPCPSRRSWQTW